MPKGKRLLKKSIGPLSQKLGVQSQKNDGGCCQRQLRIRSFNRSGWIHLSFRAATPGSSLPSKSSKEAPPPVLQWVTLSSVPYFLQAVAVSPPPMTVTVPAPVASTTASISFFVPVSNLAISKTPMGPFQMMVLLSLTAWAFSSIDFGPQSKPMKPSGIPVSFVTPSLISPSSPNLEEQVKSTGRMILTPSFSALAKMSGTILAPSSS
mmetsp:Transcript_60295/g.95493  ORF Transcript_60295/g.95493 Transcript_60295/m.95493 type:complete len:208 (-) Transcript_60295:835-1458(-)